MRQVVISHEATHLATDAPLTSGVPLWLLEGFADYVALHDVDLPITTTAGQIIQQVRTDGAPDHLPGPAEFDQADDAPRGGVRERLGGLPGAGRRGEARTRWCGSTRPCRGVSELDEQLQQQFGLTEAELTRGGGSGWQDLAAQSTDGDLAAVGCQTDARAMQTRRRGRGGRRGRRLRRPRGRCWSRGTRSRAGRCTRRGPTVFTAEQIAARRGLTAGPSGCSSWASLAVSLAVACWLGFTSSAARLVGPGARALVGAGGARGRRARRWSAGSPPCRSPSLLPAPALEYGLSHQAWADVRCSTSPRASAVGVVATAIALVVLVGVARRWPRAWPAVAGGARSPALVMLGSFVYPVLVEPLFNHFEPLPDGPLRTQVLELADAGGRARDDVLVADASRRTTTLNAYVSGFGARAGWSSTTTSSTTSRGRRCSPSSPTSWPMRGTTTC